MLMEIDAFCRRVESELPDLVDCLSVETQRQGGEERKAWQQSLPRLSEVLRQADLNGFHVQVGRPGSISLEYRLPAASAWCDAVVLGRGANRPSAVMLELKNWDTTGDSPGPREGLIRHLGSLRLHPSEQVRGYVEYCQRFHSAVLEREAVVEGCVFFTSSWSVEPYSRCPHGALTGTYPVFGNEAGDLRRRLPEFLRRHLKTPDPDFAREFEDGRYLQDRNFVLQVARAIEEGGQSPFVLLDEQRAGFEHCMERIASVLSVRGKTDKAVIVIEGPPGSGKSVLAAHLWAALTRDERFNRSVVLTTTSGAQRSNWEQLFKRASGTGAGRGIVIPATRYNPGLSPHWVKDQRARGEDVEVETWKENLSLFHAGVARDRCPDDSFDVSIVDEAHALIDPSAPGKKGIPPSGWALHAGPQAWHIIRASRVSIFLLDSDQSYRDNETTDREGLERWAREFGEERVTRISLGGAQYRCGGSREYLEAIEGLLGVREHCPPTTSWRRRGSEGPGRFLFEVVDTPFDLDDVLRGRRKEGASVRLLASYGRPWKTKGASKPHALPASQQDFQFEIGLGKKQRTWSRIWNYAPSSDYTLFVQAPPGCAMHNDPLCEVGCPYVVRGFDFDYVGLLWMDDLVWRDGQWVAQVEHVHESAWPKTVAAARREARPGAGTKELVQRLVRGYRILLSRAILGAYLWIPDAETRAHVDAWLGDSSSPARS
jgi:uncharacterized protein